MFNRRQTIGMKRREQETGLASGLTAGQTTCDSGPCVTTKNRPLSRRLLLRQVGQICCILLATHLSAQEFNINGELNYTYVDIHGNSKPNGKFQFTASVQGAKWLISIREEDVMLGKKDGPEYIEIGCDGTDTYRKLFFSDDVVKRSNTLNAFNEYCFVSSGLFPIRAGLPERIVWLAYASNLYLEEVAADARAIDPIFMVGPFAIGLSKLDCSLERMSDRCGLPKMVEFKLPSNPVLSGQVIGATNSPPFDAGYVGYVYETHNTTNINGCDIPLSFEVRHYRPPFISGSQDNKPSLANRITGSLSKVENKVTLRSFVPSIRGAANLFDGRFTSNIPGGVLVYEEHDRTWLDKTNIQVAKQLKAQSFWTHEPDVPTTDPHRLKRKAAFASLAIVSILSAGLLLRKSINTKKGTKYNES